MTHLKVQQPTGVHPARDLTVGDRIAARFLPDGDAADIVFLQPYEAHGHSWVLSVHLFDDGIPDVQWFLADAGIPLERAAAADLHDGRTSAALKPKPDTLLQPLGRAAALAGGR